MVVVVGGPDGPSPIGPPGTSANTTGKEPADTEEIRINITSTERSFVYTKNIEKYGI
jgi:hypothetical protein